jgi:hypothetical protein
MEESNHLPKPISTDEDYKIACYFHDKLTERFKHWKIKFHLPTFELKQYTHILQNGWNIYYQFGYDNEPYMEVYSTHRMTSDSYHRYYLNGKTEMLKSLTSMCIVGKEDEFNEWNNEVAKIVYNKDHGILRGI